MGNKGGKGGGLALWVGTRSAVLDGPGGVCLCGEGEVGKCGVNGDLGRGEESHFKVGAIGKWV